MDNINSMVGGITSSKKRYSNLELYRIIVMFLIVCHHYVVNSEVSELMRADDLCARSVFF